MLSIDRSMTVIPEAQNVVLRMIELDQRKVRIDPQDQSGILLMNIHLNHLWSDEWCLKFDVHLFIDQFSGFR